MPWNQNGGGWKGGGGPWGQGPVGGGSGGPPPDLEEILRRSQDRIRKAMPGGPGGLGIFLFLRLLRRWLDISALRSEFIQIRWRGPKVREVRQATWNGYKFPLALSSRRSHRRTLYSAKPC